MHMEFNGATQWVAGILIAFIIAFLWKINSGLNRLTATVAQNTEVQNQAIAAETLKRTEALAESSAALAEAKAKIQESAVDAREKIRTEAGEARDLILRQHADENAKLEEKLKACQCKTDGIEKELLEVVKERQRVTSELEGRLTAQFKEVSDKIAGLREDFAGCGECNGSKQPKRAKR